MKLVDLNKDQDIGSNSLLVELGPFRIVVDAGIHPKKMGKEALPDLTKIAAASVDYIILTHCHLDHLGALPVVANHQPEAQILLTHPSSQIAPIMLGNSHTVMMHQKEEHGIPEYPFYTPDDIERLKERFVLMNYGKPRVFTKNGETLEITFFNAGHILGAAGVLFVYKHRRIFFTGDVLFRNQRTLKGAMFPAEKMDTLVMETTRGRTERKEENHAELEIKRLITTINRTLSNRGSCLLPVFALGRMQEILYILNEARKAKQIPKCPIYCSGLGMALVDTFDHVGKKSGLTTFRQKILHELGAKSLRSKKMKPGNMPSENALYILSSGMLVENTPSYAVAASLVQSPANSICFVGYCDKDTPGGKLLATPHEGTYLFENLNFTATVKAKVERFDLSGHAEREELLEYATVLDPRAIVLTHGEEESRSWFTDTITEKLPNCKIINPIPGQEVLV